MEHKYTADEIDFLWLLSDISNSLTLWVFKEFEKGNDIGGIRKKLREASIEAERLGTQRWMVEND